LRFLTLMSFLPDLPSAPAAFCSPAALPIGGLSIDASLVGYTAVSFLFHLAFMFVAFYVPPDSDSFELDSFDMDNRFITQVIKPDEEVKEEEEPEWLKDQKQEAAGEQKAAGAEGKSGKKDIKVKNRKLAVKGSADAKEAKIAKDREVAYNAGALSVLNSSTLAANFGSGNVTSGFDPITSMGDGAGTKAGDAYGFGAFGTTGMGRGGGGISDKSFGAGGTGFGGLATRNSKGGKTGYASDAGNLEERATKVPQVVGGSPAVKGSLSKEIIRRVIRRHIREVKYCYEQQLIKNKALAGRVVMKFTISATGRVAGAAPVSNSTGSGAVASCVAGKVRRWVFPQPKGGGIVVVTYPFVFSAK
ncbi:MAG: AgmX/PglI C-terminal domain-containing protein, partial [Myxococcota bacterium]